MCRGLIKNSWRDITIWLCITFIILLLQDNATRAGLLLEIKDLFQRLCLCPESPTVDITAFQCSPSGIFLSVEGILTYSDEEGKITASTIIDLLMLHTISSRPSCSYCWWNTIYTSVFIKHLPISSVLIKFSWSLHGVIGDMPSWSYEEFHGSTSVVWPVCWRICSWSDPYLCHCDYYKVGHALIMFHDEAIRQEPIDPCKGKENSSNNTGWCT